MNSLERINAAVTFQKPDRVPVIAQVFGHSAILSGHSLGEFVKSGEIVARCQMKALDHYGYDAVFAIFDTCIEAEACGAKILYKDNLYPAVQTPALTSSSNLDAIDIPNPKQAGRMPDVLKALNILSKEVGNETLVVGCVIGPMTVTTQLLGIEDALYMAVDHPDQFEKVLDFASELIITYGKSQIDAGAHLPIVFDPSASPVVVPPAFFREFILPRHKKVLKAFKEYGSIANWVHVAGPALPIFPFYTESGVDIANMDYNVDPLKAQKALPKTCLDGNIKSVSFIDGTPEEIFLEAKKLINLFSIRGGYILSSGCEIPPESKPENIAALLEAV
ncbi:uroporphyrinogen decarboxylase [Candidatus Magnetomorum sp. HK-1]|nr:uroporphyrinogen decarboxylase [Candidatus Magnetomorum sp. HK-1]